MYSVLVTGANSCTNTSATIAVQTVSVNNIKAGFAMHVFPNPTGGLIYVNADGTLTQQLQMQVYDVWGRLLINQVYQNPGAQTISLAGFDNGIYFIQLVSGNQRADVKVILNK